MTRTKRRMTQSWPEDLNKTQITKVIEAWGHDKRKRNKGKEKKEYRHRIQYKADFCCALQSEVEDKNGVTAATLQCFKSCEVHFSQTQLPSFNKGVRNIVPAISIPVSDFVAAI